MTVKQFRRTKIPNRNTLGVSLKKTAMDLDDNLYMYYLGNAQEPSPNFMLWQWYVENEADLYMELMEITEMEKYEYEDSTWDAWVESTVNANHQDGDL